MCGGGGEEFDYSIICHFGVYGQPNLLNYKALLKLLVLPQIICLLKLKTHTNNKLQYSVEWQNTPFCRGYGTSRDQPLNWGANLKIKKKKIEYILGINFNNFVL